MHERSSSLLGDPTWAANDSAHAMGSHVGKIARWQCRASIIGGQTLGGKEPLLRRTHLPHLLRNSAWAARAAAPTPGWWRRVVHSVAGDCAAAQLLATSAARVTTAAGRRGATPHSAPRAQRKEGHGANGSAKDLAD